MPKHISDLNIARVYNSTINQDTTLIAPLVDNAGVVPPGFQRDADAFRKLTGTSGKASIWSTLNLFLFLGAKVAAFLTAYGQPVAVGGGAAADNRLSLARYIGLKQI